MKLATILLSVFLLSGCLTSKKATDYLKKKDKLDDVCAENYPAKETFIKGDTITVVDTTYSTDTLDIYEVVRDTVHHTKFLPGKTITKTKTVTDTVKVVDNALINSLQDDIREKNAVISERDNTITQLRKDYDAMKGSRNKFRWWFFIVVGAIGAYTFLRIKKIIRV